MRGLQYLADPKGVVHIDHTWIYAHTAYKHMIASNIHLHNIHLHNIHAHTHTHMHKGLTHTCTLSVGSQNVDQRN